MPRRRLRWSGAALLILATSVLAQTSATASAPASCGSPGGGRAVAFHAGGSVISSARIQEQAPTARFYPTGRPGMEPAIGITRDGVVFADDYPELTSSPVFSAQPGVLRTTTGCGFTDLALHVGPVSGHPYTADPYLYVDPRTDRVFWADLIPPCSQLTLSSNEGKSWTPAAPAGCTQTDHETIFAGPAPRGSAQPSGYPDVVYYCSITGGALNEYATGSACSKSLNGGLSFLPTKGLPYRYDPVVCGPFGVMRGCDGATGHGFVGPDGTVFLPKGWDGQPHLAVSHDEGDTWRVVQVAGNGMNTDFAGTPDHEATVVADAAGNVYYAWVARDRLPYLAVSHDEGLTWGPPMQIGVPGLHQADQPVMAVGSTGRIAVFYMGSTNAPLPPFPDDSICTPDNLVQYVNCPSTGAGAYEHVTWNGYLTETVDALAGSPTFYGGPLNDPARPMVTGTCGPGRCQQEYDFEGVAISPVDGTPWAVFIDGCTPAGGCGGSTGEEVLARFVGGPPLAGTVPRRR